MHVFVLGLLAKQACIGPRIAQAGQHANMAEQIEVDAVPIGDGTWMAAEDPASGVVYYANQVTGATQWEWPTEDWYVRVSHETC